MRRLMMSAAALGAALLLSAGAFAQVPADPNNPNEKIPDKLGPPSYGTPINLADAKKVADAAFAEAQKRGWNAIVPKMGQRVELNAEPPLAESK